MRLFALLYLVILCSATACSTDPDFQPSDEKSDLLEQMWDCKVLCEASGDRIYNSSYRACAFSDVDAVEKDGQLACGAEADLLEGNCARIEDPDMICSGRLPTPTNPVADPYSSDIEEARQSVIALGASAEVRLIALDFYAPKYDEVKLLAFYDPNALEKCVYLYRPYKDAADTSTFYILLGTGDIACEGHSGLQESIPQCSSVDMSTKLREIGASNMQMMSFEGGFWWNAERDAASDRYRLADDC